VSDDENKETGPILRTPLPGPRSRELAARLARVESANVTHIARDWPIFLQAGAGAFLIDVDGNRLLDMTGCFAVAAMGHGPTAATDAGAIQFGQLSAGLGDVHPTETKVALLERLARLVPFANARTILGCNGGDAVEAAFKTARLTTGKPGVITFTGGYHGLSYGALAGTSWPIFREPFADQVPTWSHVATFPAPYRLSASATTEAISSVRAILDGPAGRSIGAIIVEPIQGRGGEVIPPDDFLPRLRELADRADVLLIFDEIYCGLGRSGRLWACEHVGVLPDLLLVGKALGGGFPISACVGNERAMAGWPVSAGEAIHTYTFLGHPVGCAMACAALDQIVEQDLPARAAHLGLILLDELRKRLDDRTKVGEIRGRGLMVGIELVRDRASRQPASELAVAAMKGCLSRGLLVLAGGIDGNVLSLTPPLTVTASQLATAAEIVAEALAEGGMKNG
jgi:4-aminobutyrate aminotransferase/(S)-3-amino-2-methylpropionate transaminase